ncbi:Rhamnosyl O-methyltransferase [Diplonema papillatum]|nr:Rhamnosyl O-methyltransferase [Diplonema papillatum]
MMRSGHTGGMTNTKLLLVVCGVSMMMNVSLVMNAGLASSSCTQQLQMSELNYKATLRQLENERKRQTGDSKCPTCQACPEEAGQVVEVNDEEQDQQDVKVAQVAQMGTDKNPPWVWLPGREIVDFHVWKPEGFKTDNTIYDPKEDAKLQELFSSDKNKYARSPIPMGSARIRVAPAKWITLDEFAFAHDVFFEEWQRFSFGNWLGVKCQQDPMDAFAIQDMLWRVKPDLLIEVGTNNGGGAIFYASIMQTYNPKGHVVTLDVKPVNQNWMTGKNKDNCKGCITGDEHPLWTNTDIIKFIQGDITTKPVQLQVEEYVKKAKTVLVVEDASHRYPETLTRMKVIAKYVTPGSYMLVQDTKMDRFVGRLRKKYGNLKFGPMRSVDEFINANQGWQIDRTFEYYIYSQHHRGFLKREG